MFKVFFSQIVNIQTMGSKFIIISIIGIIAINLIILFIVQRTSRDKELSNYLRNSK